MSSTNLHERHNSPVYLLNKAVINMLVDLCIGDIFVKYPTAYRTLHHTWLFLGISGCKQCLNAELFVFFSSRHLATAQSFCCRFPSITSHITATLCSEYTTFWLVTKFLIFWYHNNHIIFVQSPIIVSYSSISFRIAIRGLGGVTVFRLFWLEEMPNGRRCSGRLLQVPSDDCGHGFHVARRGVWAGWVGHAMFIWSLQIYDGWWYWHLYAMWCWCLYAILTSGSFLLTTAHNVASMFAI